MRRQSEAATALWFGVPPLGGMNNAPPEGGTPNSLDEVKPMGVILISLLKFYKAVISPWLPPSCRFVPTCSEYAREAIERHGALRGSGMALYRLLRCQPFCAGGHDPVK